MDSSPGHVVAELPIPFSKLGILLVLRKHMYNTFWQPACLTGAQLAHTD